MKRATSGFTVIELAITLAVIAIVVVIAVPSMTGMVQSSRLTAATNNLITTLNYARAEAVRRGASITVTATNTSNWAGGWTVAEGVTTLRTFPASGGGVTMSPATAGAFTFTSLGRATPATTITVCDTNRSGETGRIITISATGRISVANTTTPCS